MNRDKLTPAQQAALILRTSLPADYVSTVQGDRILIARMFEQLHGRPVPVYPPDHEQEDRPDEQDPVKENLAALNEIIAEMTSKVSDDPDFTELVVRQLRYHSWSLGYEFRGERPPL